MTAVAVIFFMGTFPFNSKSEIDYSVEAFKPYNSCQTVIEACDKQWPEHDELVACIDRGCNQR